MLKISDGISGKDRIRFNTNGYGATAIRKENGEIYFKYHKKNNEKNFSKKYIVIYAVLFMILILKSFVFIPQIRDNTMHIIWYFIPTFFYMLLLIFSIAHARITGGKELLKNHAAEHMAVSAYKKLKRIPTITEVKKFSRINKNCGIKFKSALITGQLIGFIVFFYGNFKIPEILLYIIPLLLANFFPFNILGMLCQFFTTSKPDEENIKLAIAALKALEELSSKMHQLIIEHSNKIYDDINNVDSIFDELFED